MRTYLATLGRFDEAIARVKQAYRFDPLALESRNEALWIYYFSGRLQETVEQCSKDDRPGTCSRFAFIRCSRSPTPTSANARRPSDGGDLRSARRQQPDDSHDHCLGARARWSTCRGEPALASRIGDGEGTVGLPLQRRGCGCRDVGDPEQAFESLEQRTSALGLNALDRGGSPNGSASRRPQGKRVSCAASEFRVDDASSSTRGCGLSVRAVSSIPRSTTVAPGSEVIPRCVRGLRHAPGASRMPGGW